MPEPRGGGPVSVVLGAEARLRRLLIMLPWLMERGDVPLVEVAERFHMTPAEVTRELELASMCGLPPFVDELIDVFIDEEMVFVGVPRLFTKPLRLTAPEGFALLTAGRAAMALPGADHASALARGLDKLAAVLDETASSAVVVDLPADPVADELVAAIETRRQLQMTYWTASRDEVSERIVSPQHLFNEHGDWFLVAFDHDRDALRTFRVDRIQEMVETGAPAVAVDVGGAPTSRAWAADEALPRVTLHIAPAARWIVERYPVDAVVHGDDGSVTATLPVMSERWLERLLLRAGPDVTVASPDEWRDVAATAARRILARYR